MEQTTFQKRLRKPKGLLRLNNQEKLVTLSTQNTRQRQTKQHNMYTNKHK